MEALLAEDISKTRIAGHVGNLIQKLKLAAQTFSDMLHDIGSVIDNFEDDNISARYEEELTLAELTEMSNIPPRQIRRLILDEEVALENYRSDINKKLKAVDDKIVKKVQELTRQLEPLIQQVLHFEERLRIDINVIVSNENLSSVEISEQLKQLADLTCMKFMKLKHYVDNFEAANSVKLENIYSELLHEIKKLSVHSTAKLDALHNRYVRLLNKNY